VLGDSVKVLETLDDSSIDIVITDPPYGVNYTSNWSKDQSRFSKIPIVNDTLEEAKQLLDKVCEILVRKTKTQAHIYIFTRWDVYPEMKAIVDKYFTVKNLLVWDTCSHGMGDLTHAWGNQTEYIIFAIKGNKELVKRMPNILKFYKASDDYVHSTQKPVALITKLLNASAHDNDVICDPFMGGGSTIRAAVVRGNLNYIGIEIDKNIFERAKKFIESKMNEVKLW